MENNDFSFSKLVQGYWRMDSWQMSKQQRLEFINQHLDLGINTVDHAHVYGDPSCEALFGEALILEPSLRQQLKIITKCGIRLQKGLSDDPVVNHYDTSQQAILRSVEQSLTRLKTDYLDVLLIHRPDYLLNADEVAETFMQLRQDGKVLQFGVSNFKPFQYDLLQSRLDFPLVTNQVEVNPLHMNVLDDGTLDHMQYLRTRPMAWSCLAGGDLFNLSNTNLDHLRDCLQQIKEELNAHNIDQILYAWVLMLPSKPVPIIGSGKIKRLKTAVAALNINLSREQWYRIWVAAKGHQVP